MVQGQPLENILRTQAAFVPAIPVNFHHGCSELFRSIRINTTVTVPRNPASAYRTSMLAGKKVKNVALAIDVGTSGTKAGIVCSESGELLSLGSAPHPTISDSGRQITQNLSDWVNSSKLASQEAIARFQDLDACKFDVVAVTGSMQNLGIVKGASGRKKPDRLAPGSMLLYSDARAVEQSERLSSELGTYVPATSLLAKLAYLDQHVDVSAVESRGLRVACGASDAIVEYLCGSLVTDPTNLSTTGLSVHPHRSYAENLFEQSGLEHWLPALPVVQDTLRVCGEILPSSADAWGLSDHIVGVPVVHAGGDAASTTIGAGCVNPTHGRYIYMGTSGWVGGTISLENDDPVCRSRRAKDGVFELAHPVSPELSIELGSMSTAGSCLTWAAQTVLGGVSVSEVLSLARKAPIGSNGVLFMPWLAGRRCPQPSTAATASFRGISLSTTSDDLARAVIEGVAFGMAACFEAIGGRKDDHSPGCNPLTLVGGGARSPLMGNVLSGVFDAQIYSGVGQEVAVLGAARGGLFAIGEKGQFQYRSSGPFGTYKGASSVLTSCSGAESSAYGEAYGGWKELWKSVE